MRWYKWIVEPRQNQADDSEDQTKVRENKAEDVHGVIAKGPELGVGQTVDDEEDWRRDVTDHRAPKRGNAPILAGRNDNV